MGMSDCNRIITTVESHTLGEPFRLITSGLPVLQGKTIIDKRNWLLEKHDYIRTSLMLEPRGHADMYGGILTTPDPDTGSKFGIIFIHNEGYSDHCGHGTIALATILVQLGWCERVVPVTKFSIDAPCGVLELEVEWDGVKVGQVSMLNVESFVYLADIHVKLSSDIVYKGDLCFGGAFYFYLNTIDNGIDKEISMENYQYWQFLGMQIKNYINDNYKVKHPFIKDINKCYGTIFDDFNGVDKFQKNCCVFANGQIDRSPTGSGTCGRLAQLHHHNKLARGEEFINNSIIDTSFKSEIVKDGVEYGGYQSVVVEIKGEAFITGYSSWVIDDRDPLYKGFSMG